MSKSQEKSGSAETIGEVIEGFDSGVPWTQCMVEREGEDAGEEGGSPFLELLKYRTRANGDTTRVYEWKGTLRAPHVLYFAQQFATSDYGDNLIDVLWIEADACRDEVRRLSHGFQVFGLISPYDRSYEACVAVDAARSAWLELEKHRVRISFDFDGRIVTVEEFARRYPNCGNGSTCEWLYFEGEEGELYENNRTLNTYSRIWCDGVLTGMEWADADEKIDFVGKLKPVKDPDRIISSVSFHKDRDDVDEDGIRFFAAGPDGKPREYEGLIKFVSDETGNHIFVFTGTSGGWRKRLEVYASLYDPMQWRELDVGKPGQLELRAIDDPKDLEAVKTFIDPDGELGVKSIADTAVTKVGPPTKVGALGGKVRALLSLRD